MNAIHGEAKMGSGMKERKERESLCCVNQHIHVCVRYAEWPDIIVYTMKLKYERKTEKERRKRID